MSLKPIELEIIPSENSLRKSCQLGFSSGKYLNFQPIIKHEKYISFKAPGLTFTNQFDSVWLILQTKLNLIEKEMWKPTESHMLKRVEYIILIRHGREGKVFRICGIGGYALILKMRKVVCDQEVKMRGQKNRWIAKGLNATFVYHKV